MAEDEEIIERGLGTFVDVGCALARIRDSRRYKTVLGFATFEAYTAERWGMDKPHAHRTICAAEVVGRLVPIGTVPSTESQARPLTSLKDPDQQRAAWTEAVDTAPVKNGKPWITH